MKEKSRLKTFGWRTIRTQNSESRSQRYGSWIACQKKSRNSSIKLQKKKIDRRNRSDQLRWGYGNYGNFNIKEASGLERGDYNTPAEKKWSRLWNLGLWPKITLFIWLLMKGRILTWDNLRRRGMTEPSKCVICNVAEETMDHLLNQCSWSSRMWREGMERFYQTRRDPGTILEILILWESKTFKNPIVRCLWELLLGFTTWNIWKERNGHIFEGRTHSPRDIWKQTRIHIREMLGLRF